MLRRATFGPRVDEVDRAERAGLAATVAELAAPTRPDAGADRTPPPAVDPDPVAALPRDAGPDQRRQAQRRQREQIAALTLWWLDRMVSAEHQLHEKLTFFWHGHWATSAHKVRSVRLLLTQQQTLYRLAGGGFGALVHAMIRDPALIWWLDGQRNTARAPNENLARELMELFTLGIGNYSETDVRESAKALTGWRVDPTRGTATIDPARRDPGPKTILGRTAAFDADGLADLLVAHEATARFIPARLWFRFATGEPCPADVQDRLSAAFGAGRDITAALRAVFTDPAFGATRGQLVKQPVEWAVGAMRQLGVRPGVLDPVEGRRLIQLLTALGQILFVPPSVGGWPSGAAWLTTAAAQVRLRAADLLATNAAPEVLDALTAVRAAQRPEALARLLVVDAFTSRTRGVLAAGGTTTRPADSRRLLALALVSPEYTVH